MQKIFIIYLVVFVATCLKGNAQSFSFKALSSRDFSIGEKVSPEYPSLKNPITLSLKGNILSAKKADGKNWMPDVVVKRIIPFKKASSRGVMEEYFLEYIDDSGLTIYATYKKYAPGLVSDEIIESLTIPITIENNCYAFSYTEYLSDEM